MQPTQGKHPEAAETNELISFGSIADYTAGGDGQNEGGGTVGQGPQLLRPRGPRRFNHTDGQPSV